MKTYLGYSWDLGTAMGEMFSSMLLVFLILIARNIFAKEKNKLSLSIGLITFISILIGWAVGSTFKGSGHGLSMLTPALPIMLSFHYDVYDALGFIIGFQIIGSLIGFGMYMIYKLFISNKKEQVAIVEPTIKVTTAKSALFQPIVVLMLLGISILDFTAYNTGMMLNAFAISVGIALITLITQEAHFVMFSPFVALAEIAESAIDKKPMKKILIAFAIEMAFHILAVTIVSATDVALLENREVR